MGRAGAEGESGCGMSEKKAKATHIFERDEHEYYTEPQWLDQAIFRDEKFVGSICDPACGSGRVVQAARDAGYIAYGSDIVVRWNGCACVGDFFRWNEIHDNVVCNPPYNVAQEFVERALAFTRRKVVMILPYGFTYGKDRSAWLEMTPLRRVLNVVPRPSMPPGKLIEEGFKPGGGRVDYQVLVWQINYDGKPEHGWLRKGAEEKAA